MSLPRFRQRQDRTYTYFQFAAFDETRDLCQVMACDVDQKKPGFNAMTLGKVLIRCGDRRDQLATSPKDLERTLLGFTTDQIDDRVHISNFFLEALGAE